MAFTYHLVNIKLHDLLNSRGIDAKFTYHLVNIKLSYLYPKYPIYFVFTYHLVNIKLVLDGAKEAYELSYLHTT